MGFRLLTLLYSLGLTVGCAGGQTGEIAATNCEVRQGIIEIDEVDPSVGLSAADAFASLSSGQTARLSWSDTSETTLSVKVEAAADLTEEVEVLGGEDCSPQLRAMAWLTVETADGRLKERIGATLRVQRSGHGFVNADPYLDSLVGTFPDTPYADGADPAASRLLLQLELEGDAARGTIEFTRGQDGAGFDTVGEM